MKVVLRSDFRDYYDDYFDLYLDKPDASFERNSTGGMRRLDMFKFLESHGYKVPRYGLVHEMKDVFNDTDSVVFYWNQSSHRGEDKDVCYYREAVSRNPIALVAEFLGGNGKSLRYLKAGYRSFWIKYESSDDWRSNCGNSKAEVLYHTNEEHKTIKHPLFAIDFVLSEGGVYAVDYNIAPQISGTGIEDIVPKKDMAGGIKTYINLETAAYLAKMNVTWYK